MNISSAQKEPRVVDMLGSCKGYELKPFTLSFLEKSPEYNDMSGGHQTYYATGAKQDVQFDPD